MVMAKRFLSPVDQMIQQARKITAAYLKSRLPRTFTRDELDRLAETLNEMIDRLESSTRAVQEFSSNVSH
jgi:two-component system OmpR family sensor kinase